MYIILYKIQEFIYTKTLRLMWSYDTFTNPFSVLRLLFIHFFVLSAHRRENIQKIIDDRFFWFYPRKNKSKFSRSHIHINTFSLEFLHYLCHNML